MCILKVNKSVNSNFLLAVASVNILINFHLLHFFSLIGLAPIEIALTSLNVAREGVNIGIS